MSIVFPHSGTSIRICSRLSISSSMLSSKNLKITQTQILSCNIKCYMLFVSITLVNQQCSVQKFTKLAMPLMAFKNFNFNAILYHHHHHQRRISWRHKSETKLQGRRMYAVLLQIVLRGVIDEIKLYINSHYL